MQKEIGLNFAKFLVEVKTSKPLHCVIHFRNKRGRFLSSQCNIIGRPEYELDVKSLHGHGVVICRKANNK